MWFQGPHHPFKTKQASVMRNTLAGYAEKEHISDFAFETQRRNYHAYGRAVDPSKDFDANEPEQKLVTSVHGVDEKAEDQGANVWYNIKREKRKRNKHENAGDIDNWQGPWAKYKVSLTVLVH